MVLPVLDDVADQLEATDVVESVLEGVAAPGGGEVGTHLDVDPIAATEGTLRLDVAVVPVELHPLEEEPVAAHGGRL